MHKCREGRMLKSGHGVVPEGEGIVVSDADDAAHLVGVPELGVVMIYFPHPNPLPGGEGIVVSDDAIVHGQQFFGGDFALWVEVTDACYAAHIMVVP